jgi:sugar phosphate isomerase/epimerase
MNMKISTDNGTIRNVFGDVEAVRLIAEAGFDGIDYTFYGIDPNNDILALPDDERYALAMEVKKTAEECGIDFPTSHAALSLRYDEGKDSKNYQDILRSMEFASWIGCKQMVVHTLRFPLNEKDRDAKELVLNKQFVGDLLEYAEKLDLNLVMENLFRRDNKRQCYFGHHGTPEELNAFIDEMNHPRLRACCDLGHCALTGCEPEDFIRGMDAERLTVLHVQDTDYKSDTHTIPYLGKHNWDAVTDALAEIGFKGTMNLEVLHFYEEFPADLLPAALKMAAASARKLADMVEQKMENKQV